jgi:hypothetical protein
MVNGQFVVQQGQLVRNVYPGRPVHSDYWQQKQ